MEASPGSMARKRSRSERRKRRGFRKILMPASGGVRQRDTDFTDSSGLLGAYCGSGTKRTNWVALVANQASGTDALPSSPMDSSPSRVQPVRLVDPSIR